MNKLKKGDLIEVMRGKDSGKRGEILKVSKVTPDKRGTVRFMVLVQGVNIIKKSQKPNPQLGIKGGIIEKEKEIDISNVMLVDKKTDKPTRVGFKIDTKTGKTVRLSKKSGEIIE